MGVWTNGGAWDLPDTFHFQYAVSDPAAQPLIQYIGTSGYQIRLPGEGFALLQHSPNVGSPTTDNLQFIVPGRGPLTISGSRTAGYQYSELATWLRPDLDFGFTLDLGVFAFGLPTPPSGVPLSGSATYQGTAWGVTDAIGRDSAGNSWFLPAEGTVSLAFNFGTGTLGGNMHLFLNEGMGSADLGAFSFNQPVFSRGSTTYSGNFSTTLQGFNFFNGRFTGPNAEETIGNWAVPFQYQGGTQQALGAWIARRGN